MSKTFRDYLAESSRTYRYRVLVTGDADANFLELFKHNLKKFDPVEVSGPTRVPVNRVENDTKQYDYDHSFDCNFRYPATEPMIKQVARLLGYDENKVSVTERKFADSFKADIDAVANAKPDEPLLTSEDAVDSAAVEASSDYSNSYLSVVEELLKMDRKNGAATGVVDSKFTVNPFDRAAIIKNDNQRSPMSKVSLPDRPATGASNKGARK